MKKSSKFFQNRLLIHCNHSNHVNFSWGIHFWPFPTLPRSLSRSFIAPLYIGFGFSKNAFLTPTAYIFEFYISNLISYREVSSFLIFQWKPHQNRTILWVTMTKKLRIVRSPLFSMRYNSTTNEWKKINFSPKIVIFDLVVQQTFCFWKFQNFEKKFKKICEKKFKIFPKSTFDTL